MKALAAAIALAAALGTACAGREDPNALRNQGEDCLSCHKAGGKAPRSLFTVSGTVFRDAGGEPRETGAGAVAVVLTDAAGRKVELLSNAAGNFWTKEAVAFPARVALRAQPSGAVKEAPPGACAHGNCNACHSYERPGLLARGRLVRP
ncbi:MAG: hypothetical protein NDI82_06425 [Anaeromyxobacteraceae bacterium]|nr:hypothetical protein [Anaeromyxobacteraceae bacterium]